MEEALREHVPQRAAPGKRGGEAGKTDSDEKRVFKKQASFIANATDCSVLHVTFRS